MWEEGSLIKRFCKRQSDLWNCKNNQAQEKHLAGQASHSTEKALHDVVSKIDSSFNLLSCLSTSVDRQDVWYVDSSALRHMSHDRSLFKDLKEFESGKSVHLSDDRSHPILGIGTIFIFMPSREITNIRNVLYVPGLTKNLLCVKNCKLGPKSGV